MLFDEVPSLILGGATLNYQYTSDPEGIELDKLVRRAFTAGVNAIDTSPYYGPSEELYGAVLKSAEFQALHPRSSYILSTKAGRISASEFDYSSEWIRRSVLRSCERLGTSYLDIVFAHDIEFVSFAEVLVAVTELRKLRDEGCIRFVGISGYPIDVLVETAEKIKQQTGEAVNIVQSYANCTIQNQSLISGPDYEGQWLHRLTQTGVSMVWNASLLAMGLLRGGGVPIASLGDWHPAPIPLRERVAEVASWLKSRGQNIEEVALEWSLESWAQHGALVGGRESLGVSVIGVSSLEELDKTLKLWDGVKRHRILSKAPMPKRQLVTPVHEVSGVVDGVRKLLGEWQDYTWPSPPD